jgi:hypothetical protein
MYLSILVIAGSFIGAFADTAFVSTLKNDCTRPSFVGSASSLNVATLPDIASADVEAEGTQSFASLTNDMFQDKCRTVKTANQAGPFAPLVLFMKGAMGENSFNQVRGTAIKLHTAVIRGFMKTSDSSIGDFALRALFLAADKDGDGLINQAEIQSVLHSLGFTWLEEKQIQGIFDRADVKIPNHMSLEEFVKEAPKTLSINLVKLAKKNGGKLGFLA